MDTDTMILRFRDLVTSENGTIEQHKAIIAKHGYVWWGWWNKDSEKVPDDFSLLSTQAKESPISVFLVDSGQNLLYRAACSDIGIHKKTKGSSPDKDKTPEYYRDQDYYAWFRFTSIEPCEENELKQYSYIHCNNLFKVAMITFEGSEVTIQFYRLHSDQISEDALDQKVKIQL